MSRKRRNQTEEDAQDSHTEIARAVRYALESTPRTARAIAIIGASAAMIAAIAWYHQAKTNEGSKPSTVTIIVPDDKAAGHSAACTNIATKSGVA
ncbi:hypothetical protein [Streptosporangium lutulentum]|uniref:Uncharacterized protein n=1 Tax=Streptosporangium lutulentum TaxID=1461250 RepID=A0ABT9QQ13_9ACTN|nr:hypothetical protein [Streptosporangium lutulentum]MDP9847989.1 hypothetical protein [Streptosporangium lutulentum]